KLRRPAVILLAADISKNLLDDAARESRRFLVLVAHDINIEAHVTFPLKGSLLRQVRSSIDHAVRRPGSALNGASAASISRAIATCSGLSARNVSSAATMRIPPFSA